MGGINVFRGRRLEQASADALPLTQASLVPGNQNSFSDGEERNDTQKSGFRENNTSMALFFFPPSQSSAASFTYFIIYSHIVPSKLVGVGLVFHKKAVREAEHAGVRGLPL